MTEYPGMQRDIGAERSMKRRSTGFGKTGESLGEKINVKEGTCKCPKCGYEEQKISGITCEQIRCPRCETYMAGA